MSFEKIQEIISEDNLRAKEEVKDFYAQMEELNNEAELTKTKVIEIDTEKTYMISIKSKGIPEKDMTLSLAISKNAEEICFQNSMKELMVSPPATTFKDPFTPLNLVDGKQTGFFLTLAGKTS